MAMMPLGCGPQAPSPVSPVPTASSAPSASAPATRGEPPEEPIASLRTGELLPTEHRIPTRATVLARFAADAYETLALEVVLPISAAFDWSERVGCRVSVEGALPYAFAAIPDDVSAVEGRGLGTATIWMRRSRDQEGKRVDGVVYTPQLGSEPGHKIPFFAEPDAKAKNDPKIVARWALALARHLREVGTGPWPEFAAARLEEVFGNNKMKRETAAERRTLSRWMETTTGLLSVQEALQHDRPLLLAASKEKRTLALTKLTPPKSAPQPWGELLGGLSQAPSREPLADAVPAEFWYLRASDLSTLFRLGDELEAWGTPAANLMDRRLAEFDIARRYETELGVLRTALGRLLGPELVESVALAGSDPYLREGSDLTAVFKVRQPAMFDAALDGMMVTHAKAHGGTTKTEVAYGSTSIFVTTSPDRAVRQHRARAEGLEIVSNSLAAMKRVLDTIARKHARLADEKDFQYMVARDASEHVFGFFGERFVAEVTGPRQKVLEARRQMAAAELMTPGFAALLYGWFYGRSPQSVDELVASKLLRKDELKHTGGTQIDWRPGEPPRSSWGEPSELTPLIDLPSPDMVTESERTAYDQFSRTYETYWSRYIDPAALRVRLGGPKLDTITVDLRVMPLIEGTDYREILELAGQARVSAPPPRSDGVRVVVGIGPTAGVRRELSGLVSGMLGRHAFKVDFLGDWAMVGVADRTRLTNIAQNLRAPIPQVPEGEPTKRVDEILEAARVPAYAAVEIRSASGAAFALAALRKMADETLRGMLTWTDAGIEHGTTIFRVAVGHHEGPDAPTFTLFYALTSKELLVSLDEGVLHQLVADLAEGRGPVSPTTSGQPASDRSQLVFDLRGRRDAGLYTLLSWLLSEQLVAASAAPRAQAEAILRGAPERAGDASLVRALNLAYFGAVPTTPYGGGGSAGGSYTLGPDGVKDPILGSANSPRWPNLPVPGSIVDRLLGAIGAFRSEIAFDAEGNDRKHGGSGLQSLHVRTTIDLRRP
jgi:hypothetical protein